MITCIIRAIGERTLNVCKYSLFKGGFNPVIITGNPFNVTLKNAYEYAIKEGAEYTIMVDADVVPNYKLFNIDLINYILDKGIDKIIIFKMDDFIFRTIRIGGIKIYKTSLLKEAICFIDDNISRPESIVNKRYGFKKGLLLCKHGYHQYYSDIWRTAFYHGIKSNKMDIYHKAIKELKLITGDDDCRVLLEGLIEGKKHKIENNIPCIDYSFFGIKEKEPIAESEYDSICIGGI